MQQSGQGDATDSPTAPEARIIMEVVGDQQKAGWCIVVQGTAVHAGAEEGGLGEATKTAVRQLLKVEGFQQSLTYVGDRKIRMLLNDVYPNVIRHPKDACIPEKDIRLARSRAMTELNGISAEQRQLEEKRDRRRREAKRKRYIENRLLPRLNASVRVALPPLETVAGIAWLAEDGRHAVRPVRVAPGDTRTAELWALYYLLKAINEGRLLRISMNSSSAMSFFENRHHIITRTSVYPAPIIEVLRILDATAVGRDIIMAHERTSSPVSRTAARLAEFARQLHHSGEETPEQWQKIDGILLQGIGYDRKTGRKRTVGLLPPAAQEHAVDHGEDSEEPDEGQR